MIDTIVICVIVGVFLVLLIAGIVDIASGNR